MKYTMSKDGVPRVTLRAEVRLTKEELDELRAHAKADGVSLKRFMVRCLRDGMFSALEADDPTTHNCGENDA